MNILLFCIGWLCVGISITAYIIWFGSRFGGETFADNLSKGDAEEYVGFFALILFWPFGFLYSFVMSINQFLLKPLHRKLSNTYGNNENILVKMVRKLEPKKKSKLGKMIDSEYKYLEEDSSTEHLDAFERYMEETNK
jgi:hypothetical protein